MRPSLFTAVLALSVALLLAAASAANPSPPPQMDTATATGDNLILDDFSAVDIEVDAHSGPAGENPGGSASFVSGGILSISGPVTCLDVSGNTAVMTVAGPFSSGRPYNAFIVKLVDNGGGGLDRFEYFPASVPGNPVMFDCHSGPPSYFGGSLIGRAQVSDTPSPPPSIPFVSPPGGATGVARTTPVVAAFNHLMNKPSVQAAFSLKRTGNGAAVAGSFGGTATR